MHEDCQDDDDKGRSMRKQRSLCSKYQVRRWNLTAVCHHVALLRPRSRPSTSVYRCYRLKLPDRPLPQPRACPSCKTCVLLHEAQPAFPHIALHVPSWTKPMASEPLRVQPRLWLWFLFLLLCCCHMSFLEAPQTFWSCSRLRAFALSVPSAWSVLFHMCTWLIYSLISFKCHHLIKCHLLREALSDHPSQTRSPVTLSLLTLLRYFSHATRHCVMNVSACCLLPN